MDRHQPTPGTRTETRVGVLLRMSVEESANFLCFSFQRKSGIKLPVPRQNGAFLLADSPCASRFAIVRRNRIIVFAGIPRSLIRLIDYVVRITGKTSKLRTKARRKEFEGSGRKSVV